MSLAEVRAVALGIVLVLAGLLVVRRRAASAAVVAFLDAPSHPVNLAVLRVAVFALLLIEATRPGDAYWFSQLPPVLRVAPPGLESIVDHVSLDPALVRVAETGFVVACLLAMVGCFTRTAATGAVVLGVYVLGIPQLFGKLNHYHHLLWFAAVLAASPCGDALSLDRLRGTARRGLLDWRDAALGGGVRAVRYGLPLRTCWLLIGLLYAFPGFWKLWASGDAWIFGDSVRLMLHEKWLELGDFTPPLRIDRYPDLYRLLGLSTIAFELAFVVLLFGRRTRRLAIAGGLVFHLSTWLFMQIHFWHLVVCYVAFLDLGPLVDRLRRPTAVPVERAAPRAIVVVGGVLIGAALGCGVTGVDSWPFAVYPRFHYRPSPLASSVEISIVPAAGGRPRPIEAPRLVAHLHSSRWVALQRRIARAHGAGQTALVDGLIAMLRADGLAIAAGDRIVVDVVRLWIDPEARMEEPVSRRRVGTWQVGVDGALAQKV